MELKSLKRLKRKNKTDLAMDSMEELYPYGFRLRLDKEDMSKLALDAKKLKIGQPMTVNAIGQCQMLFKEGVEIQLTDVAISTGKSKKFAEYQKAQKAGPGE